MEPTTDKTELAEMPESDPRHFNEIKVDRFSMVEVSGRLDGRLNGVSDERIN